MFCRESKEGVMSAGRCGGGRLRSDDKEEGESDEEEEEVEEGRDSEDSGFDL